MQLAPLLLSIFAGSATIIGAFLAVLTKHPSKKVLGFSLGFAAGIMLLVSLTEMLPAALNTQGVTPIISYSMFILGLVCYFLIDRLLPHAHPYDDPKECAFDDFDCLQASLTNQNMRLKRTTFMLVLGVTIHNFPEGIATYVTASANWDIGVGVAIAVAIHNIPEGLAVAVPIYVLTGSKMQAILWAGVSGASEILGGILAYSILGEVITETFMANIMAAVSGIMVALAIDELIPLAKETDPARNPSIGILCGMTIMGFSLILLQYF